MWLTGTCTRPWVQSLNSTGKKRKKETKTNFKSRPSQGRQYVFYHTLQGRPWKHTTILLPLKSVSSNHSPRHITSQLKMLMKKKLWKLKEAIRQPTQLNHGCAWYTRNYKVLTSAKLKMSSLQILSHYIMILFFHSTLQVHRGHQAKIVPMILSAKLANTAQQFWNMARD